MLLLFTVGLAGTWGFYFLLRAATGKRLQELEEAGETLGAQERSWIRTLELIRTRIAEEEGNG